MARFHYSTVKYNTIEYSNAMIQVGLEVDFELTKYTPYLACEGKVWGVYCEYFGQNQRCANSMALYSFKND